MDPLTLAAIAAAVAAVAPVVGDLIGRAMASGDMDRARQLAEQARDRYNITPPQIQQMAAHLQGTAFSGLQADPQAVAAQRQALTELQRVGQQGPENIEYRAAMDSARATTGRDAAARDEALRTEMQARGAPVGQMYAQRAANNQAAAERESSAGFSAAAEGRRQALTAMEGAGAMGGTMRAQSWNEGAQKAEAADQISRFNEANRAGAVQQDYANRLGLAEHQSAADTNQANLLRGYAAQTQTQFGNYGQAAGEAAGTVGQDAYQQWVRSQRQQRQPGAS